MTTIRDKPGHSFLVSDPTWPCEMPLRLSAEDREGTDCRSAHSAGCRIEFAIGRRLRTRFALRENRSRTRKAAEDAEKAGLATDTGDSSPQSSEPSSLRFYGEGELILTTVAEQGRGSMA
jgi:hypothetical protein